METDFKKYVLAGAFVWLIHVLIARSIESNFLFVLSSVMLFSICFILGRLSAGDTKFGRKK